METGVTSAFGVAAFDVAAHKPAVVAGIKASLGQSFGNDATLGFKPSVLGL